MLLESNSGSMIYSLIDSSLPIAKISVALCLVTGKTLSNEKSGAKDRDYFESC